MNKIRFFLLQALFLCTPILYAWLYIPGIQTTLADIVNYLFPSGHWSGFESVKVLFFLCITTGVIFLTILENIIKRRKVTHTFLSIILIFFIWSLTSFVLNKNLNPYFFMGNAEKNHGWFFYLAIFSIFWVLKNLSQDENKKLFHISFIGFLVVTAYAFLQKLGLDPLASLYNSRLDASRVFSTLGNPNYLAGYVLMLTPILLVYRFSITSHWPRYLWEAVIFCISGLLIYWTGSYLGWALFGVFIGYITVNNIFQKRSHKLIFWILFGITSFVAVSWIWTNYSSDILEVQKMKGFIARWYLWKTGIAALSHDVWHFCFGFGPDGFLSVSEKFRHPLLSVYEDPTYRIDRSHNVFIDFALHFGVLVTTIIMFFVATSLKSLSANKRASLLLFALYFSFNIPVLVHFLLLLQIFNTVQKNEIVGTSVKSGKKL